MNPKLATSPNRNPENKARLSDLGSSMPGQFNLDTIKEQQEEEKTEGYAMEGQLKLKVNLAPNLKTSSLNKNFKKALTQTHDRLEDDLITIKD